MNKILDSIKQFFTSGWTTLKGILLLEWLNLKTGSLGLG